MSSRRVSGAVSELILAPELVERVLAKLGRPVALKFLPEEVSQDFLALWKDADPDIPILQEAQAEYAQMR